MYNAALIVLSDKDQSGCDQCKVDIEPRHKPRNGAFVVSIILCRTHSNLRKRWRLIDPCLSNSNGFHDCRPLRQPAISVIDPSLADRITKIESKLRFF